VERLLEACGVRFPGDGPGETAGGERHPDLEWARSGAMMLSGAADGPPLLAPAPLASRARRAAQALGELAAPGSLCEIDGAALLAERAALFGLKRRGSISPSGSCRLLRAGDGWLALNLARDDDRRLLPAWLGEGDAGEAWGFAAERLADWRVAEAVARGRLLGLPVAPASEPPTSAPGWCRVAAVGTPRSGPAPAVPRVVDLSSLWAGPLCGQLLQLAGARVVKVESVRRPDGARSGPAAFFDLLNAGKRSVALDFGSERGRGALRALVESADVVIEASRPRALAQLGVDAESLVRRRPGLTWVSITGYGRSEPEAGWVAFGDDAAVAAGLAVATGRPGGTPLFCGDAIADPLAGLHAAVAALASQRCGGGHLLDVSLRAAVADVLGRGGPAREARVRACGAGWEVLLGRLREPVRAPRARRPGGRARALGADTAATLGALQLPC
jgi:hypothetical protein